MSTPSGWYPDPDNASQQRYWDGENWTDHYAPALTPSPVGTAPPKAGISTAAKVGIGVAGAFLLLGGCAVLLGSVGDTGSTATTPTEQAQASAPVETSPSPVEKPKLKGEITHVKVPNPATIAFTAIVKNPTDIPVKAMCFVTFQDASGTYKGHSAFEPDGEIVKGAPTGFAGQITVTNEGAAWVTQQSIECEPR